MSPLFAWMGAILALLVSLPTGLLSATPASPTAGAADAPIVRQPGLAAGQDPTCVPGWSGVDTSFQRSILSSVVTLGSASWAVGLTTVTEDPRYPLAAQWDGHQWTAMSIAPSPQERALFGIDRSSSGRMWAVGYHTTSTPYYPMLMRFDKSSRQWVVAPLGPIGSHAGALLGVRAQTDLNTWAVGYKIGKSGQRPMAIRRVGTSWQDVSPHITAAATGALMAVDTLTSSDAWAVGWEADKGAPQPYLAHWNGTRWSTGAPEISGSEGGLISVAMASTHDVWAVGYRVVGGAYRPAVQRWDGHSWRLVPFPNIHSVVGVLRGVQIGTDGQPVVVGTRWDAATGNWRGIAAHRHGTQWYVEDLPKTGDSTELRGLAMREDGTAIVVGASGLHSMAVDLCPAPQASTIGGTAGQTPPDTGPTAGDPSAPPSAPATVPLGLGPSSPPIPPPSASPSPSPSPTPRPTPKPTPRPTPRRPVVARDMTAAAGLEKSTASYGAVRADFNGDGWPDLFIGRHSNPGWLVYNNVEGQVLPTDPHSFVAAPGVDISRHDRHGCTAGDFNGDGRLDLYCANGAFHGAGLKGNELYMQQPDGTFVDRALSMRASDPFGRGRLVVAFDLNHDKYTDLFLANRPARTDGLPSVDRVLANVDGKRFVGQSISGFDASSGTDCLRTADLDHDGWQDILLCERAMDRPGTYGLHILRNVHGRLVDVTATSGIPKAQAVDAIAVDMDGDHQLDIVEVTPFELRIYFRRQGRYVLGYTRPLQNGVAVASGDVDGDGDQDLYVVQGTRTNQRPDLMLLNRGDGRGFSNMPVPRVHDGSAESVTAIDYDRNGLTDFLVLNGNGVLHPGPVQLIAFFPRPN